MCSKKSVSFAVVALVFFCLVFYAAAACLQSPCKQIQANGHDPGSGITCAGSWADMLCSQEMTDCLLCNTPEKGGIYCPEPDPLLQCDYALDKDKNKIPLYVANCTKGSCTLQCPDIDKKYRQAAKCTSAVLPPTQLSQYVCAKPPSK